MFAWWFRAEKEDKLAHFRSHAAHPAWLTERYDSSMDYFQILFPTILSLRLGKISMLILFSLQLERGAMELCST